MKRFDESVILNIYRNYNKDESVTYLNNVIKMLRYEIDEIKSELDEKKWESGVSDLKCKLNEEGMKVVKWKRLYEEKFSQKILVYQLFIRMCMFDKENSFIYTYNMKEGLLLINGNLNFIIPFKEEKGILYHFCKDNFQEIGEFTGKFMKISELQNKLSENFSLSLI